MLHNYFNYRLEFEGVDVGDRWNDVYEACSRHDSGGQEKKRKYQKGVKKMLKNDKISLISRSKKSEISFSAEREPSLE